MIKRVVILFSSIICSEITFNYSSSLDLINEIESIEKEEINNNLYLFPFVDLDFVNDRYFNLSKDNDNLRINPIFAIRYSNAAFEMFEEQTPSDLFWITPGIEMNFIKPISVSFFDTGISFQAWARFNKHSAYGFDGETPNDEALMFPYNPTYSFEFCTASESPENAVDFDEGEGAIALTSPWLDVIFGKFRTKMGPSFGGNLSISSQAPGFAQFQLRLKSEKVIFSFILGELYSGLLDPVDNLEDGTGADLLSNQSLKRYIVNHRIDYKIKDNFRIGLYEQIIVGDNLSFLYMIPTMPFWSAQHSLGDTDNLQMGFDMEYLKNNNRFYMALIIDEWAPYDTFNSDHHNWFGGQFGYSRLLSSNSLFKFEYTRIEPQVYTHDSPINEPFHHSYPLGFWSGGDSEDVFFKLLFKLKKMKDLEFNLRHTIIGSPEYITDADFLEGDNKRRTIATFKINKTVVSKIGPLKYVLEINQIENEGLYDSESFTGCQISLLYNINY